MGRIRNPTRYGYFPTRASSSSSSAYVIRRRAPARLHLRPVVLRLPSTTSACHRRPPPSSSPWTPPPPPPPESVFSLSCRPQPYVRCNFALHAPPISPSGHRGCRRRGRRHRRRHPCVALSLSLSLYRGYVLAPPPACFRRRFSTSGHRGRRCRRTARPQS